MPQYITDLHFHSKYSRAVSRQMDLEHISDWAGKKGLDLVTTADFTHPAWFKELKSKLKQQSNGFYQLANGKTPIHFALTTEISCIYRKHDATRRIHVVIIMPNLAAAEKFNAKLNAIGNRKADGRPILGLDVKELLKIALDASDQAMLIPAHIWTPWFSLFGSESGFDKIEECFEEMTPHIFTVETGISSDPPMNWRIKQLDKLAIVSFSDAHSMEKMGREATVFALEKLSYSNLTQALKQKGGSKNKIASTIEFYPEEGRYHWDGHRNCKQRLSPTQTIKLKGICPVCKKSLTVGVCSRVEKLAGRPGGYQDKTRPPFRSLVPLREIIAEVLDQGVNTKGVQTIYHEMLAGGKSELNILLNLSLAEIIKISNATVASAVEKVRQGKIDIEPGYDGEYGIVKVFSGAERKKFIKQQERLL